MENGDMGTRLRLGMKLGVLPWLPAVPGADYPSYQIHQYSNNLQQQRKRERERERGVVIIADHSYTATLQVRR